MKVWDPVLTSGSTQDTDNDGKIDAIVLSIDQDIDGLTVDASDFSVTGYTISSASRTASGEITLVLTEGSSLDTDARPAVQVVGSVDGASSGFLTSGSITPADGAAPLVVSGAYKDTNADGTVDRVEVLFSEPLSYGACEYSDFSFGGADGAGVSVASCSSGDDAYGIFTLSGTPSNDTSLELTFTYTASLGTANSLDDAADNALLSFSALALTDEALPARLSSAYQDANADGTVDRVELVFSEAVTLTYADADWTATAHGLTGFDVTGISSGNGTDTLYLSATASAHVTGIAEEASQPTLAFAAMTGSLVDSEGSALSSLTTFVLLDEAAP
ncbi:hypothetical protein EBT31_18130, partial [bacterium]|nr:hypothetical protein [bacterium]